MLTPFGSMLTCEDCEEIEDAINGTPNTLVHSKEIGRTND
jgi:hypothetical protein